MKILAIETATEACSAALYNDGEITHRFELAPRKHTQLILPMMDEVLSESGVTRNQLDAIAFGRGPGAFTGLRIPIQVWLEVLLYLISMLKVGILCVHSICKYFSHVRIHLFEVNPHDT